MWCRKNIPNVVLDVLHLLFSCQWCDVMWGSGRTYFFRSHHGYDSKYKLFDWDGCLADTFCEDRESQYAMSQLKIPDRIAYQELVRMRNNIFQGIQVQPRHLVTKAWQAGGFVPGIPTIHTVERDRFLAPSSGLLCVVIIRCPHDIWCHNRDPEVAHLPKEEQKGLSSLLVHWRGHREPSFLWKALQKRRDLAQQYVKSSVFPVIFMSLRKKEIRNWSLHSLLFINVSIMCTLCCRLMMQFSSKINCCFRQPSIFYDCKTISLLKNECYIPQGTGCVQHQSGV